MKTQIQFKTISFMVADSGSFKLSLEEFETRTNNFLKDLLEDQYVLNLTLVCDNEEQGTQSHIKFK